MDFHLQTATPQDDSFLAELSYEVRAPEFASLPASVSGPLLEMQHRAQSRQYAEQFPNATNEIVWIEGQRGGRLLVSTTAAEMHLVDIALLCRFRGQGVGTQLVGELCRRARAEKLPLRLSVQSGNVAQHLYKRLGFMPTGGDGMYLTMELGAPATVAPMESSHAAQPKPGDVETLNLPYFQALRGKSVGVRTLGGLQTVLIVVDATPLRASGGPNLDPGDSFRVEFSGPLSPVVPPETVEVAPEGAAPQVLFLSPLGPLNGAMQYEAIFNRMRLAEGTF